MLATTESVIVEQDRVLDTDILRDVTALIAQLASAIDTRKVHSSWLYGQQSTLVECFLDLIVSNKYN